MLPVFRRHLRKRRALAELTRVLIVLTAAKPLRSAR